MTEQGKGSTRGARRSRRDRLPPQGLTLAAPSGFESVRLTFEQAEASIEAAADRLSLPRFAWDAVDGGVSAPLFIMPEGLLRWRKLGRRIQHGHIYVIVNTVLDPASQATAVSLPSILVRSFDTMLRVSYRQALNVAVTFSLANNLPLSVASIAETPEATEVGGMLTFETSAMQQTFASATKAAQADDFWRTPAARTEPWADFLDLFRR